MPSEYGHRVTVGVCHDGVMVRSGCGREEAVTPGEAREIAAAARDAVWGGVFTGGGAGLTARPFERVVIVTAGGYASAAECERFADDLEAAADAAELWREPEANRWGKRKHKREVVV